MESVKLISIKWFMCYNKTHPLVVRLEGNESERDHWRYKQRSDNCNKTFGRLETQSVRIMIL